MSSNGMWCSITTGNFRCQFQRFTSAIIKMLEFLLLMCNTSTVVIDWLARTGREGWGGGGGGAQPAKGNNLVLNSSLYLHDHAGWVNGWGLNNIHNWLAELEDPRLGHACPHCYIACLTVAHERWRSKDGRQLLESHKRRKLFALLSQYEEARKNQVS